MTLYYRSTVFLTIIEQALYLVTYIKSIAYNNKQKNLTKETDKLLQKYGFKVTSLQIQPYLIFFYEGTRFIVYQFLLSSNKKQDHNNHVSYDTSLFQQNPCITTIQKLNYEKEYP